MCIDIEGQAQLLDILKSYFANAAKYHPKPEDARKTTYFSRIGADFIYDSTFALHRLQPTSPLFPQHEHLLQYLTTAFKISAMILPPIPLPITYSLRHCSMFFSLSVSARTRKCSERTSVKISFLPYCSTIHKSFSCERI